MCTSLLAIIIGTAVGCGSSEKPMADEDLLDYMKTVVAEERDHFEQSNGQANANGQASANAQPAATAPQAADSQFFPVDERTRNQ
jgi:hypothetical protein